MTTVPARTRELIDVLRGEFGSDKLLTDPAELNAYGADESHVSSQAPIAVFLPTNEDEVARCLKACGQHGVPVTPSGARTGKSGGAIPTSDSLVLSLEKMDRILEISTADMVAVVEPGVITGNLMTAVEEKGLFYPPDPASLKECAIGGNIAENAGGPRAFKYGVTKDFVLGLRVALMDGTVLKTGHRSIKGVAGYDLTSLFVGSEGTLGVVTQATLRLLPKPKHIATALLAFESLAGACEAVEAIILSGNLPRTLELMDATAICAATIDGAVMPSTARAALVVELDGDDEKALTCGLNSLKSRLASFGLACLEIASTEEKRERLWTARRNVSRSLKKLAPLKASEDIAVPRSKIPECVAAIEKIGRKYNVKTAAYGHAGDGNLHVNFLYDSANQSPQVHQAISELMELTLSLGGTITGEHGIGLAKREFLPREIGGASLDIHRRLKAIFDPDGLLNPGKIF